MKEKIVKTIKVSAKGQIAIPEEVRKAARIATGDTLILVESGGKILLEKPSALSKVFEDEFFDMLLAAEESLRDIWDGESEDIWDEYMKEGK